MEQKRFIIMGIILWMSSPFFLGIQLLDPVSFWMSEYPEEVRAGEEFRVGFTGTIEEGWYLYSIHNDPSAGPIPTSIEAVTRQIQISGRAQESEAVLKYDPNFDTELGLHAQEAQFTLPVRFTAGRPGPQTVVFGIRFQACDDISCLPPVVKEVSATINLVLDAGVERWEGEAVTFQDTEREREPENPSPGITRNHFLLTAFLLIGLYLLARTIRKRSK